jgi:hypothetical protein
LALTKNRSENWKGKGEKNYNSTITLRKGRFGNSKEIKPYVKKTIKKDSKKKEKMEFGLSFGISPSRRKKPEKARH